MMDQFMTIDTGGHKYLCVLASDTPIYTYYVIKCLQ